MIEKLVSANNKFAFQLFSEIHKSQANENIFISPISIAIALSMTYNGAREETQTAMAKTLNFQGMSLEEINQTNQELGILLDSLNSDIKLNISNSIWTKIGIPFEQNFLQINQDIYQSQVREIDFENPQSPEIINNWIKDNTKGKIDRIIETLDRDSVMVLLNAIYFQGNWQKEFDNFSTLDRPFYLSNGIEKQHPTMLDLSQYSYYENQTFQAISLPYGEGRVSMYVFLPKEEIELEKFYQTLNQENWENWMLKFESQGVTLTLPKFINEYEITLNDILKTLGMKIAFDRKKADFSGMSSIPPELYIDEIKHKTFVEVNETGTEAAAATSIVMAVASSMMISLNMFVNRPFFFAIRDNNSGTILFMGEITNPEN
ncbi:serpin family protein [Okeania sp. SIO2B3]|uniref:serpin family protein n=1 Tax=Okeania sp. SIO2B3 TaxID=2607784 RepID=UPI0013C03BAD|nr:serpin family protein [Okeania sp. SIO2B3]NET45827.1 serpin family protein [Okeania sp. SIO2B3]